MKNKILVFTFFLGVEYDHGSEPNKKTGNGKVKFTQENENNQKWLKLMSQKRP